MLGVQDAIKNHDVDNGRGADPNDDDDAEGKGAGDDANDSTTAWTGLISARPAAPFPRPGHYASVSAPCAHVQGNECPAPC